MSEYALFSTRRNRFMVVSDEHEKLKFLQLLVMDYELLYLVNLSGIAHYRPGLLTNDRCLKTTLTNGSKIKIEIDMYVGDPSYRIIPAKDQPTEDDIEFREKLLFLKDFIKTLDEIEDQLLYQNVLQFNTHRDGLRVLQKFLKMTMPNDLCVQTFIDREIENKDVTESVKQRFQGEVFVRLRQMDYNIELKDFKVALSEKIEQIPIISTHFKDAIREIKKVLA